MVNPNKFERADYTARAREPLLAEKQQKRGTATGVVQFAAACRADDKG